MGAKLIIANLLPYPPSLILFTYNIITYINNLAIPNNNPIILRTLVIKVACI